MANGLFTPNTVFEEDPLDTFGDRWGYFQGDAFNAGYFPTGITIADRRPSVQANLFVDYPASPYTGPYAAMDDICVERTLPGDGGYNITGNLIASVCHNQNTVFTYPGWNYGNDLDTTQAWYGTVMDNWYEASWSTGINNGIATSGT
ncbi:hypothetical protein GP486_008919, partial [Trichoglossum hirsutum]